MRPQRHMMMWLAAAVAICALALSACGPDLALLDSPTALTINDIIVTGSGTGWAVGMQPGKSRAVLLREQAGRWQRDPAPPATLPGDSLVAIAQVGATLWIGGTSTDASHADTTQTSGILLSRTGNGPWSRKTFGTGITALDFVSATDGWAVGLGSAIYHFSGASWSQVPANLPTTIDLFGIAMRSSTDGWIVGDLGTFLHYDGTAWRPGPHVAHETLYAVALSATDGWASGQDGVTLRLIDGQWTEVATPMFATSRAIVIDSGGNVWVVGDSGSVFEWQTADGLWHHISQPNQDQLNTIAVTPNGTAWVGGNFSQDLLYGLARGSWLSVSLGPEPGTAG